MILTLVAFQLATIVTTVGYCTVEYVWPFIKRKFFTTNAIQQRLQLTRPLSLNKYEEDIAVSGAVHPSDIKSSFDDIGGHEQVIKELVGNLSAMLNPEDDPILAHLAKSRLYQPPSGILLYGPPGCGKTLIAKALAAESGARFINVPLSLLFDKWVGETEKYIEALFTLAKKIQPAIIFIDEIDSITRRRNEFDSGWNATMKSQFLSLWDGLLTDRSAHVVVLGATNRRQDIDEAFMRRLPLQFKIDLPDSQQRIKIIKVLLSDVKLSHDFSYTRLATITEGFSGSDLKEICRRTIMDASINRKSDPLTETDFLQFITTYGSDNR